MALFATDFAESIEAGNSEELDSDAKGLLWESLRLWFVKPCTTLGNSPADVS